MLFVDSADYQEIRSALELPGVTGVTTNPNLFARALGRDVLSSQSYLERAKQLCQFSKTADCENLKDLMIQGFGSQKDIQKQAEQYLAELNGSPSNLWLKLLPTPDAMMACQLLNRLGAKTLVTGVFTAAQAYMAMEAGADGIAVYLGRLKRFETASWQAQLEKIATVMNRYQKMFLLASFSDIETVETALSYSSDLTIPLSILGILLKNTHSQNAIDDFNGKIAFSNVIIPQATPVIA